MSESTMKEEKRLGGANMKKIITQNARKEKIKCKREKTKRLRILKEN